jgi:WD40 repeat protein
MVRLLVWLGLLASAFWAVGRPRPAAGIGPPPCNWLITCPPGAYRHQRIAGVAAFAIRPDGRALAIAELRTATESLVRVWDVASGKQLTSFSLAPNEGPRLDYSADGKVLYEGGARPGLRARDPASGRVLATFHSAKRRLRGVEGEHEPGVAYQPALGLAVVLDDPLRFHDFRTGKEQYPRVRTDGLPDWIHATVDRRSLLIADGRVLGSKDKGAIVVLDAATGRRRGRLHAGDDTWIREVSLSADDRALAYVATRPDEPQSERPGKDPCLRAWELASGAEIFRLEGAGKEVGSHLALSGDGRLLATSAGKRIAIWDLATGKRAHRFDAVAFKSITKEEHGDAGLRWLRFLSDQRTLLACYQGSFRGKLLVFWDVGTLRRRLPYPPVAVGNLAGAWDDLGGGDIKRGRRAVWGLAGVPDRALPLLEKRLRPAPTATPEKLARLIAELGSSRYQTRAEATQELARLGELALPAARKALQADKLSPEARRRLTIIVRAGERVGLTGEHLRACRAIEVLERVGGNRAMHLLRKMADGAAEAAETRAAKAALLRLDYARRAR